MCIETPNYDFELSFTMAVSLRLSACLETNLCTEFLIQQLISESALFSFRESCFKIYVNLRSSTVGPTNYMILLQLVKWPLAFFINARVS